MIGGTPPQAAAGCLTLVFLLVLGILMGGVKVTHSSTCPKPTHGAIVSISASDFANYADWMQRDPKHCKVYDDTYGYLLWKGVDGHPVDRLTSYGLTYLREVEKQCKARDYGAVRAAANVMAAWARVNGGVLA